MHFRAQPEVPFHLPGGHTVPEGIDSRSSPAGYHQNRRVRLHWRVAGGAAFCHSRPWSRGRGPGPSARRVPHLFLLSVASWGVL